jgi:hypothetical protein
MKLAYTVDQIRKNVQTSSVRRARSSIVKELQLQVCNAACSTKSRTTTVAVGKIFRASDCAAENLGAARDG